MDGGGAHFMTQREAELSRRPDLTFAEMRELVEILGELEGKYGGLEHRCQIIRDKLKSSLVSIREGHA